jgi:branched-chain amino acid transport system substrate-binding protein
VYMDSRFPRSSPPKNPRRRTTAVILVLILAATAVSTLLAVFPDDSGPVKMEGHVMIPPGAPIELGTMAPTSGEHESFGLDIHRGAVIAVRFRGPVLGHPVRLLQQDDGCSSQRGVVAARRLVRQNVVAVIGPACSSAAAAARRILGRHQILAVSPSAAASDLTDPGTPYFARTAPNARLYGKGAAVLAMRELQAKTAAVITDGTAFADGVVGDFVETFERRGGSVVARGTVSDAEAARKVAEAIAPLHPDVVFAPIGGRPGGAFARAARLLLRGSELLFSDGVFTPGFLDAAGPMRGEGLLVVSGDVSSPTVPFYEQRFIPEYRKVFGHDPGGLFHPHAFDATNMILDAMENVAVDIGGTLLVGRNALRDAFYSIRDHQGLSGNLSCTPAGDCAQHVDVVMHRLDSHAPPARVTVHGG